MTKKNFNIRVAIELVIDSFKSNENYLLLVCHQKKIVGTFEFKKVFNVFINSKSKIQEAQALKIGDYVLFNGNFTIGEYKSNSFIKRSYKNRAGETIADKEWKVEYKPTYTINADSFELINYTNSSSDEILDDSDFIIQKKEKKDDAGYSSTLKDDLDDEIPF